MRGEHSLRQRGAEGVAALKAGNTHKANAANRNSQTCCIEASQFNVCPVESGERSWVGVYAPHRSMLHANAALAGLWAYAMTQCSRANRHASDGASLKALAGVGIASSIASRFCSRSRLLCEPAPHARTGPPIDFCQKTPIQEALQNYTSSHPCRSSTKRWHLSALLRC